MVGNTFVPCIDAEKLRAGANFDLCLYQIVGGRVVVLFVFDVIVNIHPGIENINILIRGCRQRLKSLTLDVLEHTFARAR